MSSFLNSSVTSTPNLDSLLLDSLLNRLQIAPPPSSNNDHPILSSSFEDFLAAHSFSDDGEYDDLNQYGGGEDEDDDDGIKKTCSRVSKEESRLEKQIVKVILSGNTQTLKPNSGQAVSIGDHHICIGFHEEEGGSGYRVWEWHGHIMLFDDLHGYTPEYIYGNYFERLLPGRNNKLQKQDKHTDDNISNNNTTHLGLRELIDDAAAQGPPLAQPRVVHRGRNASLSRVLEGSTEE